MNFPVEELTNKAFIAINASSGTVYGLFYKAGTGVQLYRVAGSTTGLSINDETHAVLHIDRVDSVWTITNSQSSSQAFRYKVII